MRYLKECWAYWQIEFGTSPYQTRLNAITAVIVGMLLLLWATGCTLPTEVAFHTHPEYENEFCLDTDTAWAAFGWDEVNQQYFQVFGSLDFKQERGWTCVWDDEILFGQFTAHLDAQQRALVTGLFTTMGLYLCTRACATS